MLNAGEDVAGPINGYAPNYRAHALYNFFQNRTKEAQQAEAISNLSPHPVQLLLDKGADPFIIVKTAEGERSAFDKAVEMRDWTSLQMICDTFKNPDFRACINPQTFFTLLEENPKYALRIAKFQTNGLNENGNALLEKWFLSKEQYFDQKSWQDSVLDYQGYGKGDTDLFHDSDKFSVLSVLSELPGIQSAIQKMIRDEMIQIFARNSYTHQTITSFLASSGIPFATYYFNQIPRPLPKEFLCFLFREIIFSHPTRQDWKPLTALLLQQKAFGEENLFSYVEEHLLDNSFETLNRNSKRVKAKEFLNQCTLEHPDLVALIPKGNGP